MPALQKAFGYRVSGLPELFAEFQKNGLAKAPSAIDAEQRDGVQWELFYVVAPDGLCYCCGERAPAW